MVTILRSPSFFVQTVNLLLVTSACIGIVTGENSDPRSEIEVKDHLSSSCSSSTTSNAQTEFCEKRIKRYFLYDVNPGEGFNLRRDVYIRIAPLIYNLNQIDDKSQWILVLPPWGRIPHWRSPEYHPWSAFFETDQIRKYIPAIELSQYLEEYGYDSKIEQVFQLQHFPFDPADTTWSEKIEEGSSCEEVLMYKWHEETGDYSGRFWNERIKAKNASCMSLRGQASTIVKFLFNSSYKSVMFDRAEVILWDSYGGSDWWNARRSLRFSAFLNSIAESYLQKSFNQSEGSVGKNYSYVGVHLRRRDFVFGRRKLTLPSLPGAARQVFQIAKRLKLDAVFLATDAPFEEFEDFSLAFQIIKEDHSSNISLLSLHPYVSQNSETISALQNLAEGQLPVLDQIICSKSNYFIGTPDSTFTLRIFEEREIMTLDSDSTFNYLCPDLLNDEDFITESPDCKQPTKWKMI